MKLPSTIGTIEGYIRVRESGLTMEEIETKYYLSEANVYCWEMGYQCYKKNVSLDDALAVVKSIRRRSKNGI